MIKNVMMESNRIYGPGYFGGIPTSLLSVLFGYNNNAMIRNNLINGGYYGFVIKGGSIASALDWNLQGGLYGNILVDNLNSGIYLKGVKCVPVINNTLYMSPGKSASVGLIQIGPNGSFGSITDSTGDILKNNLLYAQGTGNLIMLNSPGSGAGLVSDYNCFWSANSGGKLYFDDGTRTFSTLSGWQSTGRDVNSIAADPLLIAPASGDFQLMDTSPCIDRGDPAYSDSDGSRIDIGALPNLKAGINKAKFLPDGTAVQRVKGIVTAIFNGFYYIESDDRTSGIRVVQTGASVTIGQSVEISGTLRSLPTGERYLEVSSGG
jgi:hypothetical protein